MSMTAQGMNLKNPLAPLPTERMAQNLRHIHQRKPKIATIPASKPKPSKKRKPYFYNPADRD